ncbi:umecyanin-like [Telopea speciosissima]|uniref:umecyanin-like n=1 Tax=Telopea speciosissima TaxID=54955 RepID=UPI001CC42622|nr:umecyanin-like [Telopea speciosissima]
MASCMGCMLGCLFIVAALLQGAAAQTTHEVGELIVGGYYVWKVPSANFSYATWSANQTFTVGDKLQFNFATNDHDVAVVSKAAYESCIKTDYYSIYNKTSTITIESAGEHYYICTIDQHCENNQKVAIMVSGSSILSYSPALTLLLLLGAASLFFFF